MVRFGGDSWFLLFLQSNAIKFKHKINETKSDVLSVSTGIPQGSVLGPTLFIVFSNDLPSPVHSGSLYIFADDTIVFYIGDSADMAMAQLKKGVAESVYLVPQQPVNNSSRQERGDAALHGKTDRRS